MSFKGTIRSGQLLKDVIYMCYKIFTRVEFCWKFVLIIFQIILWQPDLSRKTHTFRNAFIIEYENQKDKQKIQKIFQIFILTGMSNMWR